jgi:hypothetical protein
MAISKGYGSDTLGVSASIPMTDGGRETTVFNIRKWTPDQMAFVARKIDEDLVALVLSGQKTLQPRHFLWARVAPEEVHESYSNLITTAGWAQLFKSILGGSPTLFSATVGRIGVGTGTTGAVSSDTALGSVASMTGNNWILCGAAPTNSTAATPCTSIFVATYGATAAVGAWSEFAVDQGTASAGPVVTATAPMMNHTVQSAGFYGTKAGGTWTATATLSFT